MTTDNNQELAADNDKPAPIPNTDVAHLSPQQLGGIKANQRKLISQEQRDEMLEIAMARFLADENLGDIAPDLGISQPALCMSLLKHRETDWMAIQQGRAMARYESAKDALDKADDMLSLARAREQVKSRQWELERLLRRLYGDTTPDRGGSGTININIGINRDGGNSGGNSATIEHDSPNESRE